MMTVNLNEDEGRRLEDTFHTTPDRRLRDRCQAILMAARGRRHRQIAEDLGISVRTLQRWLNAYQAEGLAGLTIQSASGRAPHIPEALPPARLLRDRPAPNQKLKGLHQRNPSRRERGRFMPWCGPHANACIDVQGPARMEVNQ